MMALFIAGIGTIKMTDVANALDLPNAKHLDRTIQSH